MSVETHSAHTLHTCVHTIIGSSNLEIYQGSNKAIKQTNEISIKCGAVLEQCLEHEEDRGRVSNAVSMFVGSCACLGAFFVCLSLFLTSVRPFLTLGCRSSAPACCGCIPCSARICVCTFRGFLDKSFPGSMADDVQFLIVL
jgi:hypothetical protein